MRSLFLFLFVFSFLAHGIRLSESLMQDAYMNKEGFSLNLKNGPWVQAPSPTKNKEGLYFKNSSSKSASIMSVQVDHDTSFKSLKEYTTKWLKSYSQFRIEVLGYKFFKTPNQDSGFVVDIKSSSNKKSRQAVFFKDSKAIVITCTDADSQFSEVVKSCNDVINSFSWTQELRRDPEINL